MQTSLRTLGAKCQGWSLCLGFGFQETSKPLQLKPEQLPPPPNAIMPLVQPWNLWVEPGLGGVWAWEFLHCQEHISMSTTLASKVLLSAWEQGRCTRSQWSPAVLNRGCLPFLSSWVEVMHVSEQTGKQKVLFQTGKIFLPRSLAFLIFNFNLL